MTTDQRGEPRTVLGFIDIGAVENQDTTGVAVRGPLSGATVFFDPNFTGAYVSGNPTTTTGPDGSYTLVVPPATLAAGGQFVLTGGTDTSTGLTNVIPLTAPADYSVIDPFSTLVNDLVLNNHLSETAAETAVAQTLGLPSSVDLATYNLIAAAQAGDPEAPQVYAAEVTLDQTVVEVANLVSGTSNSLTVAGVGATVYSVLANEIAAATTPIDLTTTTAMSNLIGDVDTALGVTLPSNTVSGAAQVIAGVSQYIAGATLTAQATSMIPVLQAQVVAEGTIAPELASAAAGTADISDVVANNTGSNLQTEISAATYGTLIPAALSISSVSEQALTNGSTTYTFTVSLIAISAPTQTVSVDYATQDDSAFAANGDYVATSGTLTWLAGDTSPQTITVTVNGEAAPQPSKLFDVVLSNPTNAVLSSAVGVGQVLSPAAATSTSVTTSNSSAGYGTGVTFTATVTAAPSAGTPTGSVVFTANSDYLGTAKLNSSGVAVLSNVILPLGSYTIAANYSAPDDFASSSGTVSQSVVQATPTFTLSPISITYDGNGHAVTASVIGGTGANLGPATISYSLNGRPSPPAPSPSTSASTPSPRPSRATPTTPATAP